MKRGDTRLHIFDRRIRLDLAVDLIRKASGVQQVRHLFGHIEFNQIRVGADKSLFEAARGQFRHDIFNRALSVIGYGVQNNTVRHEILSSFYIFKSFGSASLAGSYGIIFIITRKY